VNNKPVFLSKPGLVCCAGSPSEDFFDAAPRGDRSGIVPVQINTGSAVQSFLIGRFAGDFAGKSRLLGLCAVALEQIRPLAEKALQHWEPDRIGLCLGSCDNGTEASIPAHREFFKTGVFPHAYNLSMQGAAGPAEFAADFLGLKGPVFAISTACSSSASAIKMGTELVQSGVCDAVIAGGADIASEISIMGFAALEALSPELSNPFSKNRNGINLGDGAAFFVLSREKIDEFPIVLAGFGESSDAYHMTAPQPEGKGAAAAMEAALKNAKIKPGNIAYVNLHGTGTVLNDKAEAQAMHAVFGDDQPPASSTKPITGHTLGAAGALELALCWGVLEKAHEDTLMPVHRWDGVRDTELPILNLVKPGGLVSKEKIRYCMSNSFAFGGCNVSLIIGREEE
jgi:3-oxoacyl-[acyl-carrier-protein] synthase-1